MSWPLALEGSLRHLFSRAPIIWENHIRISRSAIVKTRSQRKIYKENFEKKEKKVYRYLAPKLLWTNPGYVVIFSIIRLPEPVAYTPHRPQTYS